VIMGAIIFAMLSVLLSLPVVLALPAAPSPLTSKPSNTDTSLTILYQNNLNGTDDVNHISAILLDAVPAAQAAAACGALNECLLAREAIESHYSDFFYQLNYLAYDGRVSTDQEFLIENGVVALNQRQSCLDFKPLPYGGPRLPVLCTQSANASQPTTAVATTQNEITVPAGGNTFVGYRNLKSWRFSGIPYADEPQRWHYSSVYSGRGQTINATTFGSECPQNHAGNEDCLFLNIQTPYIPKAGSIKKLKPVYFWIHGGFPIC